ncbi:hypothetical protein [Edaphobacter acidisoli]|uniref:hypothetical protein n=1 Tax=Edaphobacter acidisoli TaxID=2040573 RepID=UPI001665CBB2|nr:hypothetical protein [Edaphobacter acidisoli]
MRRLAGIVALLVLLGATGPIMACVTGQAMSQQESACCRAMHHQCGEMASMGCCRKVVRHDLQQLATATAALPIHWFVALRVASGVPTPVTVTVSEAPMSHSPPGLLAAQSTVLRI